MSYGNAPTEEEPQGIKEALETQSIWNLDGWLHDSNRIEWNYRLINTLTNEYKFFHSPFPIGASLKEAAYKQVIELLQ